MPTFLVPITKEVEFIKDECHYQAYNVTFILRTFLPGLKFQTLVNILPRRSSTLLFHSKILSTSLSHGTRYLQNSLLQYIQGFAGFISEVHNTVLSTVSSVEDDN